MKKEEFLNYAEYQKTVKNYQMNRALALSSSISLIIFGTLLYFVITHPAFFSSNKLLSVLCSIVVIIIASIQAIIMIRTPYVKKEDYEFAKTALKTIVELANE